MIHREAGQAVFVHECEVRRHALTVSWGAGYPAVDVNSMPQVLLPGGRSQFCVCGGEYVRVEPCPIVGEHPPMPEIGCVVHPIAGHVTKSDDHTANLIEPAEPDPDELELTELRLQKWQLDQKHLIGDLEALLEAGTLSEVEMLGARITLLEAKRALKTTQQGASI